MFPHLLREESIRVGLEAPTWEIALLEMIALLPSWALNGKNKSKLYDQLLERERFGTTAIGDGIALPHAVFPGIKVPMSSLAISKNGIAFPSLDRKPVHIIFLTLLPENADSHRMKKKVLNDAALFFRDRFLRERLKIADTAEEAYEFILREGHWVERNVPDQIKSLSH